jgi:N-acyl homoserine lactone hydrolase
MLRIHVFNTGWFVMPEKRLYLGGGHTRRTLPVLCFVVEHPQGLLVFDAGLNSPPILNTQRFIVGPSDQPTAVYSAPGMSLSAQMTLAGLSPLDVVWVAVSHLHDDHIGDLTAFSNARLLLARQESLPARHTYPSMGLGVAQHHLGLTTVLIDFPLADSSPAPSAANVSYGVDLIGDRTLFVVPTFGHTAGHQSLLVSLSDGPVLLAGDAAMVRENYARPVSIPRARHPAAAWRSIVGLHALYRGAPGALILPSHDPEALSNPGRDTIVIHGNDLPPHGLL